MNSRDDNFKVAVITQVFNESYFLPQWLNHYGSIFGYENLVVIDDSSDDGSVDNPRILNLVKKKRALLDETDRAILLSFFHSTLLDYFDAVIYTDCDELIVLDPALKSDLYEYLRDSKWNTLNVVGLHVLHNRIEEGELNLSVPLFHQRRFVLFDRKYCKPLLSKEPIRWSAGFHISDKADVIDNNIYMFHLRSVDYEQSRRRISVLNRVQFSEESLKKRHGTQFRLTEEAYLKLLYDDVDKEMSKVLNIDINGVYKVFCDTPEINKRALVVPDRFKNAIAANSEIYERFEKTDQYRADFSFTPFQSTENGLQHIFDAALNKMISARERSRLAQCPCGSNLRYKNCHGTLNK